MTQQPQIKQYRRKVSDERVKLIYAKSILTTEHLSYERGLKIVRQVLEADAEVIEGVKGKYPLCGDGRLGVSIGERRLGSVEQFNAEWEEIK